MSLAPGARLGPYEIAGPLGAGGMGEVWRARDTRLGRDVAIKVLPDDVSSDPKALARFESEARAVAALSHPNILALYDVGQENGFRYAVTELQGESLRQALWRGAFPVKTPVPRRLCGRDADRDHPRGARDAGEACAVYAGTRPLDRREVPAEGRG